MLTAGTSRLLQLFNRCLATVDPVLSSRSRDPVIPPVFVIGAPRSGTTLAYALITQEFRTGYFTTAASYLYGVSNILSRVQKPFLHRPAPVFQSRYGKAPGLLAPRENSNYWFRWLPRDGKAGHFVRTNDLSDTQYRDMRRSVDSMSRILERPMVFKNVNLSLAIGPIAHAFPEARFVHVCRDDFLTCQSLLLARREKSGENRWWSVKIPGYRELVTRPLAEQVVEQVVQTRRIIRRDLRQFAANRFIEISYKEICNNPAHAIDRLAEWLKPLCYERYPETRIPDHFPASEKLLLNAELAARLKYHLEMLTGDPE